MDINPGDGGFLKANTLEGALLEVVSHLRLREMQQLEAYRTVLTFDPGAGQISFSGTYDATIKPNTNDGKPAIDITEYLQPMYGGNG